jgi:hypothetical protein
MTCLMRKAVFLLVVTSVVNQSAWAEKGSPLIEPSQAPMTTQHASPTSGSDRPAESGAKRHIKAPRAAKPSPATNLGRFRKTLIAVGVVSGVIGAALLAGAAPSSSSSSSGPPRMQRVY